MTHWSYALDEIHAYSEAVDWARTQPDAHTAWATCQRGDWMICMAAQRCMQGDPTHRAVVLAACECARLSLKHVPEGEDRPRVAIETAECWARREGGVTLDDVREARMAASAYAYASASAYAYAAAYAADAADAAYAAAASASAATAAAAGEPAAASVRASTLAQCADIVRKWLRVGKAGRRGRRATPAAARPQGHGAKKGPRPAVRHGGGRGHRASRGARRAGKGETTKASE